MYSNLCSISWVWMFVHYSLCVPAVCLLDSSSCGCCLMQRQMFRMESFFNMSLTELQRDLQRAQAALHNLRGEFTFHLE